MTARAFSLRISAFYAFLFLGMGVQLPFLPLWLQHKGMSESQIAAVLAGMIAVRIVAAPAGAFIADRYGHRRTVILISAGMSFLGYLAMAALDGFWPILIAGLVAQACYSPVVPLAANIAIEGSQRYQLDYGRLRLWGSLGFIVASLVAGAMLGVIPVAGVIYLIVLGQGALMLVSLLLPKDGPAASHRDGGDDLGLAEAMRVFALPGFAIFICAASLGQASHGLLYTFGSVHWQTLGYGKPAIGILWGISIAMEVLLFAFSNRIVSRFGPVRLIVAGTTGAVLRWLIMAFNPAAAVLFPCQALHGLSFSTTHLGTMHFILHNVPAGLRNTAQGLFSAASGGIAMGSVMLASGPLYRELGGAAYLIMAGVASVGALLAWRMWRLSPTGSPAPDA